MPKMQAPTPSRLIRTITPTTMSTILRMGLPAFAGAAGAPAAGVAGVGALGAGAATTGALGTGPGGGAAAIGDGAAA